MLNNLTNYAKRLTLLCMGKKLRHPESTPVSQKVSTHGDWMTMGTKGYNVTSQKKMRLSHRRKEVMRLRQEEGLRFEEIAERILEQADRFWENPEEATYSTSLVGKDLLACLQTIGDETHELAKQYLPGELLKLEQREQKVEQGWKDLEEVRSKLMNEVLNLDVDEAIKLAERAINMLDKLDQTMDRIQKRRSTLLPLEAPKRMEVDSRSVRVTLEDYLEARSEAERKISDNGEIIDGEVAEQKTKN